jgi:hypothetical protein
VVGLAASIERYHNAIQKHNPDQGFSDQRFRPSLTKRHWLSFLEICLILQQSFRQWPWIGGLLLLVWHAKFGAQGHEGRSRGGLLPRENKTSLR